MQREREAARRRAWTSMLTGLFVTGLVTYLALGFVLGVSRIRGASMEPNLRSGDIAVFYRLGGYEAGDIVILRPDGKSEYLIKRVIATAGDTVDIDEATGNIRLNGRDLEEAYVFSETHARPHGMSFPATVPEGSVFLLGDNRLNSKDSREFGMVRMDQIAGKVVLTVRMT